MDKTDACALIDKEIGKILNVPLSHNSVELLYKLTSIRSNIKECEFGHSSEPQTHVSNGRYDRNINDLLEKYIIARKGSDECMIADSLAELLGELSDLVVEIYRTAKCQKERDVISDSIRKMEMH